MAIWVKLGVIPQRREAQKNDRKLSTLGPTKELHREKDHVARPAEKERIRARTKPKRDDEGEQRRKLVVTQFHFNQRRYKQFHQWNFS